MINAIDQRSVDQITSGQVVTSLASAAKELVENALDAGATSIDVRLVNYGRDGFSVQDNGSGISPEDFELLAKKHATSKLRTFTDLNSVVTLGFRGEALASLCALANVVVTTNNGSGGFRLEFDEYGGIKSKQEIAAPRGTLVQVNDLFWALPVRRKDFERNSQREYAKLVSILQEYAIINPVRLTIEHNIKGRRNRTLQSQGQDLKQRLACNFGANRLKSLVFMNVMLTDRISLKGYISEPVFGKGEQSAEKQFLFINGRPTKQQKVCRAITETYKLFNSVESPFFALNLELLPSEYDVNISPDKRQILLHNEERLLQEVRETVKNFLDSSGHNVPRVATIEGPPQKRARQARLSLAKYAGTGEIFSQNETEVSTENSTLDDSSRICESIADAPTVEEDVQEDTASQPADPENSESEEENAVSEKEHPATPTTPRRPTQPNLVQSPNKDEQVASQYNSRSNSERETPREKEAQTEEIELSGDDSESSTGSVSSQESQQSSPMVSVNISDVSTSNRPRASTSRASRGNQSGSYEKRNSHNTFEVNIADLPESVKEAESDLLNRRPVPTTGFLQNTRRSPIKVHNSPKKEKPGRDPHTTLLNTHLLLPIGIDEIKAQMGELNTPKNEIRNFDIDGANAEERLSLTVRKSDFREMRVVGQFNLGFILVVKPGKDDELFVIDQHASDEIYNFERLQRHTVLSRQPLVVPHPLELSAVEELTVQHHMGIFENNGFTISVDQSAEPGSQCSLLALPYSKNTVFNEKDIHELIYRIQEAPENSEVKCSKLRAMFAMRACRSSIMVGRPLSLGTMRRVVTNLGTLDKPWNCPHGRPTLRHITTLY